jgi:protein tyrosine/serine phosphatase
MTVGASREERHLAWAGCLNLRDLGGLRTVDGAQTRWGAVVRGDTPDRLTASGWSALQAYGIRTIVDLRNDDERDAAVESPPAGVTTVHLPLDGEEDTEFWAEWAGGPQFGTPLYYRPHLDRFPERTAAVLGAIAHADAGGVLVHCVGGRDRTGQISLMLLALAGVAPEEIAADYRLSNQRLADEQGDEFLASRGTSASEVILSILAELDVEAYLRDAGLGDADLAAIRGRLR